MFKIQARRDEDDQPTPWEDTEEAPHFSDVEEARRWLYEETNAAILEACGWQFRIIQIQ
jgi:hypothetical protein